MSGQRRIAKLDAITGQRYTKWPKDYRLKDGGVFAVEELANGLHIMANVPVDISVDDLNGIWIESQG